MHNLHPVMSQALAPLMPRPQPARRTMNHVTSAGKSIKMQQIGGWIDLATYWSGDDGNAWTCHHSTGRWTNNGPVDAFREQFPTRFRGELFA